VGRRRRAQQQAQAPGQLPLRSRNASSSALDSSSNVFSGCSVPPTAAAAPAAAAGAATAPATSPPILECGAPPYAPDLVAFDSFPCRIIVPSYLSFTRAIALGAFPAAAAALALSSPPSGPAIVLSCVLCAPAASTAAAAWPQAGACGAARDRRRFAGERHRRRLRRVRSRHCGRQGTGIALGTTGTSAPVREEDSASGHGSTGTSCSNSQEASVRP